MSKMIALIAAATLAAMSVTHAAEPYDSWPLLQEEFESTGGGGIIIKGYKPMIVGAKCTTDFTAHDPAGPIYHNTVEFDALQTAGGTLCTNGRWRAKDGSASGTTPLQVFIRDGVRRRSP